MIRIETAASAAAYRAMIAPKGSRKAAQALARKARLAALIECVKSTRLSHPAA